MRLRGLEHLGGTWPCWRLVEAKVATLRDLETWWSVDDVFDANDVLDAVAEARAEAQRQADKKR